LSRNVTTGDFTPHTKSHNDRAPLEMSLEMSRQIAKPGIEGVQALADILRQALCCHSNETRAPNANPPNSAQLWHPVPYHARNLHPGPCSSVGMQRRTDRHTDT